MTKLLTKSSSRAVFVSKGDKFVRNGKYSIILSPEFYWCKKAKLPVDSISKAKKLAPSIYDGSLPKGDYSYEVRKAGDEFVIIAYDKAKILDQLKEIFPAQSSIKEVYFAQDALSDIKECTSINDKSALSNMDGIIIQVPRKCTDTTSTVADYLDGAKLNKNRIKLSASSNQLLQKRDILAASLVFGLLFLSFLSEYIIYKKEIAKLEDKRSQIVKQNGLPPTMIQIRSIKKSLGKKYAQQKALRESINVVSKLDLKDGEYISKLDASSGDVDLEIHLSTPARESEISSMIKKMAKIKSSSMNNDTLKLRIGL